MRSYSIFIIALFFCLILSGDAYSQQQLPSHFGWFPGGDYSSVSFINLDEVPDAGFLQKSQDYMSRLAVLQGRQAFPAVLDTYALSKATATLLRLEEYDHYARKRTEEEQKLIEGMFSEIAGESVRLAPGTMVMLSVYRLDMSHEPVRKMKESGFLHETGHELGEYSIIKLYSKEDHDTAFYALIADDELVVSDSAMVLQYSYEARLGLRNSFTTACPDYLATAEYFADLGVYWRAGFGHAQIRVNYDNMVRRGGDERQIEARREENLAANSILHLDRTVETEPLTIETVSLYENEDTARERYQRKIARAKLEGMQGEVARLYLKDPNYIVLDGLEIREKRVYTDELTELEAKNLDQIITGLEKRMGIVKKKVNSKK